MRKLFDRISFNRFAANKEYFCDLLNKAAECDDDIFGVLYLEPYVYDRIYFTMSHRELKSLGKRRGDPGLEDSFQDNDALISFKGRCIVLHIPAMCRKLAQIDLRDGDQDGKVLFTIHLMCCFFHELGHACHASRHIVKSLWGTDRLPTVNIEEAEKAAEEYESRLMKRFDSFMSLNSLTWENISDHLLDWEKLGPIVIRARDEWKAAHRNQLT